MNSGSFGKVRLALIEIYMIAEPFSLWTLIGVLVETCVSGFGVILSWTDEHCLSLSFFV